MRIWCVQSKKCWGWYEWTRRCSLKSASSFLAMPTNAKSVPDVQPGEPYKYCTPSKWTARTGQRLLLASTRKALRKKLDRYATKPSLLLIHCLNHNPIPRVYRLLIGLSSTRSGLTFIDTSVRFPKIQMSTFFFIRLKKLQKECESTYKRAIE